MLHNRYNYCLDDESFTNNQIKNLLQTTPLKSFSTEHILLTNLYTLKARLSLLNGKLNDSSFIFMSYFIRKHSSYRFYSGKCHSKQTLLDISSLDPLELLNPFFQIIQSPETSGHVTLVTLQAIEKFVIFKVLKEGDKRIVELMAIFCHSITHAK